MAHALPSELPHPTRSQRSANINLLSVPRIRTTFASRSFSVAAPTCGTRSHLAFATTLPLSIPSVAFLKLTASSRLSALPSGSPKCFKFVLWLTLCTLNIYLLTYLQYAVRRVSLPLLSRHKQIILVCLTTAAPVIFNWRLPNVLTN